MTTLILLTHLIIFQGMFAAKNILLRRKTGKTVKGLNRESILAILIFTLFISLSLIFSRLPHPPGQVGNPFGWNLFLSILLLGASLMIAGAALVNLKDSWRVGITRDQKTELITTGIYRFSRNPYFVSYFLMLLGYSLLLKNMILLVLAVLASACIHGMVRKEEAYLKTVHGRSYHAYQARVPRYLFKAF